MSVIVNFILHAHRGEKTDKLTTKLIEVSESSVSLYTHVHTHTHTPRNKYVCIYIYIYIPYHLPPMLSIRYVYMYM